MQVKKNKQIYQTWKISKTSEQPDWVKENFRTGFLGWELTSDSLRFGDFYGSPVPQGDYLTFDGKNIKHIKAKDFEKI